MLCVSKGVFSDISKICPPSLSDEVSLYVADGEHASTVAEQSAFNLKLAKCFTTVSFSDIPREHCRTLLLCLTRVFSRVRHMIKLHVCYYAVYLFGFRYNDGEV